MGAVGQDRYSSTATLLRLQEKELAALRERNEKLLSALKLATGLPMSEIERNPVEVVSKWMEGQRNER